MKNFYSISQYPGNTGSYFYNNFFKKYDIHAAYEPLGSEPDRFESLLNDVKGNAFGISISMPYKHSVISYLDEKSLDVVTYNSCNTVVLSNGKLYGYNTDIQGVINSVSQIKYYERITILGNGVMGRMFYKYMKSLGYAKVRLISRNLGNYDKRHDPAEVLINCTSLGTVNRDSPIDHLNDNTRLVIDLSLKPGRLSEQCIERDVEYYSGLEFYKHQFKKQFLIYTAIDINLEDFDTMVLNR